MKPVYLRFKAFGPYLNEQFIDFRSLSENGLFLICGETGSGKTTILDAMTYALYGRSSGAGRGSIESMRCNIANKEDDTQIEYVFDAAGKRYKFIRTIKMARKNYNTSQNSMVMQEDGIFVPLHENPTATVIDGTKNALGDAERIIGLSYEQFCQVIILPQGQFEKLLVADSDEKEKILVSIFKAERWQKITEKFYDMAKDALDKSKAEYDQIERKLAEFSCSTIDGLQQLCDTYIISLSENEESIVKATKEIETLEKTLEEKKKIVEDFDKLEKENNIKSLLDVKKVEIENIKERLANAKIAEKIKPEIDSFTNSKLLLKNRSLEVEKNKDVQKDRQNKLNISNEKYEVHKKESTNIDEFIRKIARLEMLEGVYEEIDELYDARKIVEKNQSIASLQAKEALEKCNHLREELVKMRDIYAKMSNEYGRAQAIYRDNISGILAEKLRDNEPCPVCGSTNHPRLAEISGEKITDDVLGDLEIRNKEMLDKISDYNDRLKNAEEAYSEKGILLERVNNELVSIVGKVESLELRMDKDIKDIKSLRELKASLKNKIESFKKEEENLLNTLNKDREYLAVAQENLKNSQNECKKAERDFNIARKNLDDSMKNHNIENEDVAIGYLMSSDEREKCHEEIARYNQSVVENETNIKILLEQLRDEKRPDVSDLRQELDRLRDNKEKNIELVGNQKGEVERIKKTIGDISCAYKKYEATSDTVRENMVLAKQLRGDTGISLQRYVLGVMFSAIITEANRLLINVHGGRYRLHRTDEAQGNARKTGLELVVIDGNADNTKRSVKSLSGGEKFLVALALSIGLSTVAQKKGMKLDAMFIDEGFGSLDNRSINDAMEVLTHIQQTNGLVGIISHVQMLRENIPVHIEIEKNKIGSNLVLRK